MSREDNAYAGMTPADTSAINLKKPQLLIGKGWIQAIALVMIFGFAVMGFLAVRTYTDSMPIPAQIVSETGETIATQQDITHGQEIFQARGLQQYGSVLGHGGYLGPDYTAEYLRMTTDFAIDKYRDLGLQEPRETVVEEWRTNRYDAETDTLVWTETQVEAFEMMKVYYLEYFSEPSTQYGLPSGFITDEAHIHDLTAFYGWTSWASSAERPSTLR